MKKILESLGIEENNYGACVGAGSWSSTTDSGVLSSVNPSSGTGVKDNSNPRRLENLDWSEHPDRGSVADPLEFKIRVTTGVKDISGNAMSSDNTTETGFLTAKSNGCF